MLIDPIPVAASAPNPALSLAITRSDGYGSERVDTGGSGVSTVIKHDKTKKGDRHYLQVIQTKDATNPYTGLTQQQTCTASISISRPTFGFSDTDVVNVAKFLTDILADSDVTVGKLIQFQS